jgi:hypothetical protein
MSKKWKWKNPQKERERERDTERERRERKRVCTEMHCLHVCTAYSLPPMYNLFDAYRLPIHDLLTASTSLFTPYSLPIHCLLQLTQLGGSITVTDSDPTQLAEEVAI